MEFDKLIGIDKCILCNTVNNNLEFPQCCSNKYLKKGDTICSLNLTNC